MAKQLKQPPVNNLALPEFFCFIIDLDGSCVLDCQKENTIFDPDTVWEFLNDNGHLGFMHLNKDGSISGYSNPN